MRNIEVPELLLAIQNGDEKAFAELYRRYHAKLYRFLSRFNSTNKANPSDILQEAFLRVWLNRDRLGEIHDFESWLFKVVSTESLTLLRKEAHQKVKVDRLKSHYDQELLPTMEQPRFMELFEIKKIVNEAIQNMPEKRRTIYLLSREEGLTASEIASKLHISTNTVYNTLTSALKDIRKSLADQNFQTSIMILIILKLF